MKLFPRGLFEDALPPIALRSQVYSLLPDRTVADLQLVRNALETFGVPPSIPGPRTCSLEGTHQVPASQTVDLPVRQQALGQGKCRANPRGLELQADATFDR